MCSSDLLAYEPEVWKLVCDGYCIDSPTVKEQQRNAKAKCVIYESLHNKDLELIMDLDSAKEIWDILHFMHGVDTEDCSVKKEKKIKKKKTSCQKENMHNLKDNSIKKSEPRKSVKITREEPHHQAKERGTSLSHCFFFYRASLGGGKCCRVGVVLHLQQNHCFKN